MLIMKFGMSHENGHSEQLVYFVGFFCWVWVWVFFTAYDPSWLAVGISSSSIYTVLVTHSLIFRPTIARTVEVGGSEP